MEPVAVPILQYAKRPVWHGRRWLLRVVWLIAFLVVAVETVRHGPAVYGRATLLYWQHQCMTYSLPPDRVVFEWAADPLPVRHVHGCTEHFEFPAARTATAVIAATDCWTRYNEAIGRSAADDGAILFLHERRTANGVRRLVALRYCGEHAGTSPTDPLTFDDPAVVLTPESVLPPRVVELPEATIISPNCGIQPYPPVWVPMGRFYAGQADAMDPSHFTVGYEVGGQRGTIDGWLQDCPTSHAPRVKVVVRDGPCSDSEWAVFQNECWTSLSPRVRVVNDWEKRTLQATTSPATGPAADP